MLQIRVIPVLLLHEGQAYKTKNFKDASYVGDPLNAVRIFNEKKIDELFVIDIDATPRNLIPNYDLIKRISRECEMPLTYAGGIKTSEMAEHIISLGVEKIGIGNYALANFELIPEICGKLGAQSVAGLVNFKLGQDDTDYSVYSPYLALNKKLSAINHARNLVKQGVGELVLNSVDRDGLMTGYDVEFLKRVIELSNCAVTIMGGAGSVQHFEEALHIANIPIGLAAGSLFTYRGRYRSVMFSYISQKERDTLHKNRLNNNLSL